MAAHSCVFVLWLAQADPNIPSSEGITPLLHGLESGNLEVPCTSVSALVHVTCFVGSDADKCMLPHSDGLVTMFLTSLHGIWDRVPDACNAMSTENGVLGVMPKRGTTSMSPCIHCELCVSGSWPSRSSKGLFAKPHLSSRSSRHRRSKSSKHAHMHACTHARTHKNRFWLN